MSDPKQAPHSVAGVLSHAGDDNGVAGTVDVLHLEPAYRHARHYIGWTAGEVDARVATHLQGAGSPLIRAAVGAGVDIQIAAMLPGSRILERRLKRWGLKLARAFDRRVGGRPTVLDHHPERRQK